MYYKLQYVKWLGTICPGALALLCSGSSKYSLPLEARILDPHAAPGLIMYVLYLVWNLRSAEWQKE
jgi:hypothetical protein